MQAMWFSYHTGFSHYVILGEAPSDKLYTSATLMPQLLGVISPPLRVLHSKRDSKKQPVTQHNPPPTTVDLYKHICIWGNYCSCNVNE
ncbi:hypothetical protein J6590_081294 [Homalodisca vitripennis]|nr:hypothetical protein J6590_081294 [Homalodisca vitripennis]